MRLCLQSAPIAIMFNRTPMSDPHSLINRPNSNIIASVTVTAVTCLSSIVVFRTSLYACWLATRVAVDKSLPSKYSQQLLLHSSPRQKGGKHEVQNESKAGSTHDSSNSFATQRSHQCIARASIRKQRIRPRDLLEVESQTIH